MLSVSYCHPGHLPVFNLPQIPGMLCAADGAGLTPFRACLPMAHTSQQGELCCFRRSHLAERVAWASTGLKNKPRLLSEAKTLFKKTLLKLVFKLESQLWTTGDVTLYCRCCIPLYLWNLEKCIFYTAFSICNSQWSCQSFWIPLFLSYAYRKLCEEIQPAIQCQNPWVRSPLALILFTGYLNMFW